MTADYDAIRGHQHAIQQVVPLLEAMRSIAEIDYRRAGTRLEPLRRYAESLETLLGVLQAAERPDNSANATGGMVLVAVSSERGLCGAFNQHLVNRVRSELRRLQAAEDEVVLVCLGRQGQRLLRAAGETLAYESPMPTFALPAYPDVEQVAIDLLDLMEERACGKLVVMYNAPAHRFQYEVVTRQLYPVEPIETPEGEVRRDLDVRPEADAPNVLQHLVVEHVLIDLYQAVVESAISEELARVAAMRLATDNARHLLEELTLDANRARQISETNALLEIISGFHAMSDAGSD